MPIVDFLRNASERINHAKSRLSSPINLAATYAKEDRALSIFHTYFDVFDTARQGDLSKTDGIVSREDLEIAALRNDEIGEAARYILEQPDLFQFLDTGSNNIDFMDKVEEGKFHATGGDGKISKEDIEAYLGKRQVNLILQDVHAQIDVAANGGNTDGSLSRNDYEAFLASGNATPEQEAAIHIVLQEGAVDGEQGIGNRVADVAGTVGKYSGYAALGAAVIAAGMTTGGVGSAAIIGGITTFGTAAGVTSTVSSVVEMGAGVITHDPEHVVSGAMGTVTATVSAGSSTITGELIESGTRRAWTDIGVDTTLEYLDEGVNTLAEDDI